jgi:hypothetical protein
MRVPTATLKRLAAVEGAMFGDDGKARGGVMLVPPVLGFDEWEALAMPALAKLAASAAEDIERHRADVLHRPPLPPTVTR